jgi:hypothetical protein
MGRQSLVLAICVWSIPLVAIADPFTVGEYQAAFHNPHLNEAMYAYVQGMVEGMESIASSGGGPVFCDSDGKTGNDTFDVNLLNNWLAVNKPPSTDLISDDFLLALKETFPCN